MSPEKYTAGKTVLQIVCNNVASFIDAGIAVPADINSSVIFLGHGFFNNQLDINVKSKILKQNGGVPRLPLIYVFSQATGYTGAKSGNYLTSANFGGIICLALKLKPQKKYRGENGEPPLVAAPQNRHRFRKIKPQYY